MRLLITGACGFVGSELCLVLQVQACDDRNKTLMTNVGGGMALADSLQQLDLSG